jgi:hypothetical protein
MAENRELILRELRTLLLSDSKLRAKSQTAVEEILVELSSLADDEPMPDWLADSSRDVDGKPPETVGDIRRRLRVMLIDLARADA